MYSNSGTCVANKLRATQVAGNVFRINSYTVSTIWENFIRLKDDLIVDYLPFCSFFSTFCSPNTAAQDIYNSRVMTLQVSYTLHQEHEHICWNTQHKSYVISKRTICWYCINWISNEKISHFVALVITWIMLGSSVFFIDNMQIMHGSRKVVFIDDMRTKMKTFIIEN